jgi:hypothetical protein
MWDDSGEGDKLEDNSEDGDELEDEVLDEDEVPCNEGNHAPNTEYDVEDPPMVVGVDDNFTIYFHNYNHQ